MIEAMVRNRLKEGACLWGNVIRNEKWFAGESREGDDRIFIFLSARVVE